MKNRYLLGTCRPWTPLLTWCGQPVVYLEIRKGGMTNILYVHFSLLVRGGGLMVLFLKFHVSKVNIFMAKAGMTKCP